MLWAFVDESGWHPTGGGLAKLTVGGCITDFEAWECLSTDWAAAIQTWGLEQFHMADFQRKDPPHADYATWTDVQRRDRLNMLLNIIGASHAHCWGFTNLHREGDTTETMYERCAHDMLLELGLVNDELGIVFASHPEYGRHNELLSKLVKHGMAKNIHSCTVANPQFVCPLQAADIVVYEIRCIERGISLPDRYPLKRLLELGCKFRLVSSAN